jgi:hypothetical protein
MSVIFAQDALIAKNLGTSVIWERLALKAAVIPAKGCPELAEGWESTPQTFRNACPHTGFPLSRESGVSTFVL